MKIPPPIRNTTIEIIYAIFLIFIKFMFVFNSNEILLSFFTPKNFLSAKILLCESTVINNLVSITAVSILAAIPIIRVHAKPFTRLVPN